MKRLFLIFLYFCTTSSAAQQQTPDIEFVESIPIETTLDNPDIRDTREVWLEMISGAKTSLDIEQFYISNQKGEPLEDILQAIVESGKRGVTVRVIADSRMYRTYPESVDMLGKQKNITSRVIDFGKLGGGIQHAKFFIIDSEELFIGSQNFDWRALKHIHEIGLRVRNRSFVKPYLDLFEFDWAFAETNDSTRKSLNHKSYGVEEWSMPINGDTVWLAASMSPKKAIFDTTFWDEQQIIKLIDGAKSDVLLQFLSYTTKARDKSTYSVLDDAIRNAATRGVKVKMIVSDWEKGTPGDAPLKSLAKIPNIEVKFSEIPEWSGGYISYARVEHCKFIIADNTAFWLGTSNAEKSYFHTSRNLGVIVNNIGLTRKLRQVFYKSWDGQYTSLVKPDVEYKVREHGEK